MIHRRRLVRFGFSLALALGMLALAIFGSWAPETASVQDFFLTPQVGPGPGLNPCDYFVTPIPPELVRRDRLRARVQSLLFGNRFSPDATLYLVVVGHGLATEMITTHFRLSQPKPWEWDGVLSAEVRIDPRQIDPPMYRIGAIATLDRLPAGKHTFHITLPCGSDDLKKDDFTIEVSPKAPLGRDHFLTEEEFLRAAIRHEDPQVLHYLVTHAVPASLGLSESELVTTDPTGLWPKDGEEASTRGCAWAEQAWFADGLSALAANASESGVRTWASFALAYLSVDHPEYRARLVAASRGLHPYEPACILAFRGDMAALEALVGLLDHPQIGPAASATLSTLIGKISAARKTGAALPSGAVTPAIWDAVAARLRPGPGVAKSADTRQALLELLGLFAAETGPALAGIPPLLDEADALRLISAAASVPPEFARSGMVKAFRDVPRPSIRLALVHWAGLGTGPAEAELAALVAEWLKDPATRHAARAGRTFAQEAALLLHKHATAAEAPALSAALADETLDWQTRTALALVLARVRGPGDLKTLQDYVRAAKASGKTDVSGLETALK